MTLHITKVAVDCPEIETLRARLDARAAGGRTSITTRFRPKREAELIGGSLYWIIRHHIVARQQILGFDQEGEGGRCRVLLSADLRPVRAAPKRAHQGWRYLPAADAPPDLAGEEARGLDALPAPLAAELAALALI